mmetsp:Transcript_50688/g.69510  ORF Transcript_50688/g.69510 Transcript_50688/m.69510 type:complete len:227 (-) Transcript_50688:314-994(-)
MVKQEVGFTNLLTQVFVDTDESIDVNNAGIEEHTSDLTSSITESVLDSSIDSVAHSLFLFVFILDSKDLLEVNLDRSKRRSSVVRSLLLLHRLLRHVHGHCHLGLRHFLAHHLLLLRNLHLHIVMVLVHSLLLVHVASATATATLSSTVLIVSIVVILSILTLHVVILVLVVVITTHVWNKIVKSHSEWVAGRRHELFLREHLQHLTTLLLLLSIDVFFRHPEINT